MRSILFIHRSVGQNLIDDGGLRHLFQASADIQFHDYNQNTDRLTDSRGIKSQIGFNFPGEDTKPADYARIFVEDVEPEFKAIRDQILEYDIVAIKSCYPNSNIKGDEQLETIRGPYATIGQYFDTHNKSLAILTSPPLVPLMTNAANARRARQLYNWLSSTDLGPQVHVFDLFDRLAEREGRPQANTLKRGYRRWLPFDSHPNVLASKEIAPELSKFLISIR